MLNWRERLRLTWELIWPSALIDTARAVGAYLLGLESTSLDSAWVIIAFFVVSPWVVRRAMRLQYPGYQFHILDYDDDTARRMSYQESLKVVWLLAWRLSVLTLAALAPISFVLGTLLKLPLTEWFRFAAGSQLGNTLGLTAVDVVTGVLFFPFLIPGMLRKRYRSFHIEVHRPKLVRARK